MRVEALSTVVAALESGKRPKGGASSESGTIPSLGGEHLNNDGGFRLDNLKYIEEQFFVDLKKGAIKLNDILIVKDGATTGKVSYVGSDFPFERAAINEHLFALTVDSKIASPRYVFSFLKSPLGQKEILKDFRGAAIGGISRGFIDLANIPLPSLDDQIRIAHLLGKVEGLIAQRKQHLQQLDDLLKSVFLEMFGDPVRNEKGWPINPLTTYMSEQPNNGLYKPQSSYGSGTKIIRIDSFYDGIVQNIEGLKRVEITDAELLKFEIRPFDILVNRVNSIEYLGKIGVVPAISEPMVYESNMMRLRLNHEAILPVYLMYFWRTPYLKSQINSKAKKAVNQASVNQQDVNGLLVPQPSIELQKQFSSIVEKVEGIKSRYQQSLTDLEALYGALSQQAFKGELDLLRVPFLGIEPEKEKTVAAEPLQIPDEQSLAIHLPDTDNLLAALESTEARKKLIVQWLNAYRNQLGSTSFSAQHFMAAAQNRLTELHPDSDFELGANDYEHIKAWVFEALASGRLAQAFDDAGNRIELKVVQA